MCANGKLIDLVQNYPILYDMKNKDYKDNIKKTEIWADIAIKLCLESGVVAKSKWRHLRDSYTKYLRAQANTAGQYKKYKYWSWASPMEFLKPHVTIRQSDFNHTGNYSDSDTENKIKSEPNEECVQYYEEPFNEATMPSLRGQKVQQDLCTNVSNETLEYLQTGKLQKCMDGVDLLFLSHAQTLKTFSLRRQATVKFEIAQIINNAELAQLEEVNPLHVSSSLSSSS